MTWGGRLGQMEERKYIEDGGEGQEMYILFRVQAPMQASWIPGMLMAAPNIPSRVTNPKNPS